MNSETNPTKRINKYNSSILLKKSVSSKISTLNNGSAFLLTIVEGGKMVKPTEEQEFTRDKERMFIDEKYWEDIGIINRCIKLLEEEKEERRKQWQRDIAGLGY